MSSSGTKIDKKKVARYLNNLAVISDRPVNDDGNLDVTAFNKLKETKWVKAKLREEGVDRKWLMDNGFLVAGWILTGL